MAEPVAASVRIGFLVGDVNGNRVVAVSDLGLVNAQLAQPVSAANYLKDVNANGTLTVADKGIANQPGSQPAGAVTARLVYNRRSRRA
jgi:hypothetical protein